MMMKMLRELIAMHSGEDKGEEWQPEDLTGESAAVLTMGSSHEDGEQARSPRDLPAISPVHARSLEQVR